MGSFDNPDGIDTDDDDYLPITPSVKRKRFMVGQREVPGAKCPEPISIASSE